MVCPMAVPDLKTRWPLRVICMPSSQYSKTSVRGHHILNPITLHTYNVPYCPMKMHNKCFQTQEFIDTEVKSGSANLWAKM